MTTSLSIQPVAERFPALEEQEVVLMCHAPGATNVQVAGTFNGWRAETNPLEQDRPGEWIVRLMLKSCSGSRCCTSTNPKPVSTGSCFRNCVNASSPPAEAPTPTIGNALPLRAKRTASKRAEDGGRTGIFKGSEAAGNGAGKGVGEGTTLPFPRH